jgi:hypothetical protein
LQNVSTGSTGGSSHRGLVIWVQIRPQFVARHLTSHRSLERDDQIGWNALVAVNALPDAWLACVAASSQFRLTTGQPNHFFDGSFCLRHDRAPMSHTRNDNSSYEQGKHMLFDER